ncbi:hypothetical protein HELRODRAFT_93501 [Helobdella robusta]|uniref:Protein SDA1 n=1 Tax=Helobdella robusta TaxID=6412 RepID=T1G8W1_HELRO|nr:hypothetical protein HELRODRAFT_93501 [Helobdella robusta]ESO12842.1 hypothetical protein HELRODRAFT_93501 [Helobdella robusta]
MSERLSSNNLPLLQCAIKKDPESHKPDFLDVLSEFNAIWNTYLLSPTSHEEDLVTKAMFIAQVSHCYIKETTEFINQIIKLLDTQGPLLDADMRLTLCRALMLMRNKNLIPAITVLQLFFNLFRCPDKVLRSTLRNYIVQDIKNINKKGKNVQLNSALQNYMYIMLKDNNKATVKLSLDIIVELYNRKVWNNEKTANIITTALFCKDNNKVVVAALKFFLGSENSQDDGESDSDDDAAGMTEQRSAKDLALAYRVGKKTKKREKRMKRALNMIQDQKKKRKKVNDNNFLAIHLLNDPQDLAERLFAQLSGSKKNDIFQVKLLKLNFISQLIGIHKLFLLQFYPFLDRFLKPSQTDVTKLLLYLAQACHDIVPPDIILTSIRTIADNFINDSNNNEVIAVGLNAVREVCNRCPLSMSEDLLHDLALFKKNKDKCVSMAAQSLIGLFRAKNPQLLHRSFRGRPTVATQEVRVLNYGELDAKDYIVGAEVLPDREEEDKESDGWQSCSDDEDDDDDDDGGSWVDVSHSSDDEENDQNKPKASAEMSLEERIEKSKKLMESRILTQEDFKKIQHQQEAREKEFVRRVGSRKRKHSDGEYDNDANDKEVLPLSQIEGVYKKRKHDKESRLETVMAGREGREKFGGGRKKKSNPHASTSNTSKRKKKNFQMLKPKLIKQKNKASYHDKKEALKKVLLKNLNRRK